MLLIGFVFIKANRNDWAIGKNKNKWYEYLEREKGEGSDLIYPIPFPFLYDFFVGVGKDI